MAYGLDRHLTVKWLKTGRNGDFKYSGARKHVLSTLGAETHEVVASDPNIDGIRAILVHFGRIFGHLEVSRV